MLQSERLMNDPIVVECANSSSWMLIGSLAATVVIALITAYVAYLNYCTRPYLLTIKEKHTKELKDMLQLWMLFIEKATAFNLLTKKDALVSTPFEDSTLFQDVLFDHDSLGVTKKWSQIKILSGKFNAAILELDNSIKRDANAQFGSRQITLHNNFYMCMYQQSVAIAKGMNTPHNIEGLKVNPRDNRTQHDSWVGSEQTGFLTGYYDHDTAQAILDYLKNTMEQLFNSTSKEYKYVEIAKRADKLEFDLITQYHELKPLIDKMLATPIFIEECEHVLRSVPPIFPSRRWFRSKWDKYVIRLFSRLFSDILKRDNS
jgi:hypothetical protein